MWNTKPLALPTTVEEERIQLPPSNAHFGRGRVPLDDFVLVSRKRSQYFFLLVLRDFKNVKRAPKFSRDLIKLLGRNPELTMGLFQAEHGAPWFRS